MFEEFIKEKRFLDNLSENTLKYYGYVFNRWNEYVGAEPTEENIKEFCHKDKKKRGFNSFLAWKGFNLPYQKAERTRETSTLF
jgi:hypothetical protein